jgi:hypothetical protein
MCATLIALNKLCKGMPMPVVGLFEQGRRKYTMTSQKLFECGRSLFQSLVRIRPEAGTSAPADSVVGFHFTRLNGWIQCGELTPIPSTVSDLIPPVETES